MTHKTKTFRIVTLAVLACMVVGCAGPDFERDPGKIELVTFYRESKTLRLEGAERDVYSFVFGE